MACKHCPVGGGCRGEKFSRWCEVVQTNPLMCNQLMRMSGLDPELPHDPSKVERAEVERAVVNLQQTTVAPPSSFLTPNKFQLVGLDRPSASERQIVVARYNEDVSWTLDAPYYCIIYNKGKPLQTPNVILTNTGREAGTYLFHIVNNYHRLACWTIFTQGAFHNASKDEFFGRMQVDYADSTSLTSEYSPTIPDDAIKALDFQEWHGGYSVRYGLVNPIEPAYCNAARLPVNTLWKTFFSSDIPSEPIVFGYGAQWAVPRHRITDRPLDFWRWCLTNVNKTSNTMAGDHHSAWAYEMLWKYLWGDATQYKVRLPESQVKTQERSPGCKCGKSKTQIDRIFKKR